MVRDALLHGGSRVLIDAMKVLECEYVRCIAKSMKSIILVVSLDIALI